MTFDDLLDSSVREHLRDTAQIWEQLRDIHEHASTAPSRWTDSIGERRQLESTLRKHIVDVGDKIIESIADRLDDESARDALALDSLEPDLVDILEEAGRRWARLRSLDDPNSEPPRAYLERIEQRRRLENELDGAPLTIGTRLIEAHVDGALESDETDDDVRGDPPRERPEHEDTSEIEPGTEDEENEDRSPPQQSEQAAEGLSRQHQDASGRSEEAAAPPEFDPDALEHALNDGSLGGGTHDHVTRVEVTRELESAEHFQSIIDDVPDTLGSRRDLRKELHACQEALDETPPHAWSTVEDDLAQAVIWVLTTRLRRLQTRLDDIKMPSAFEDDIVGSIQALTKISKEHQPGFVHGLKREHDPKYGSTWRHDIERALSVYETELDQYPGLQDESEEPEITQSDRDRAFTQLQKAVEDDNKEEVLGQVERYLDHGYFTADDERFVNLLAHRADWFEGESFPKLQRAVERARDDEGQDSSRFGDPLEALEAADRAFDVLDVWSRAHESAQRSNYHHPDKVYRALEAIAAVGQRQIECYRRDEGLGQPWATALQEEADIPIDHALSESDTTSAAYDRTFSDRDSEQQSEIERHLTFGQGNSHSTALQIYFDIPQNGKDDVDIGYCGPHLDHFSQ